MIPDYLKSAFDIINGGRASIGCQPFKWEDRLASIAQELADYAYAQYLAGTFHYYRDGHHEFLERATRHGWTDSLSIRPPDAGRGVGNRGEYGVDGQGDGDAPKDRDGWRHPDLGPDKHAGQIVQTLTTGMLPASEGHVTDFRTSWTHIGIGYKPGFMILDYGFLRQQDIIPEPTPVPEPPFRFY